MKEEIFFQRGINNILSIDEVGRGSVAGPFYVGGLLINKKFFKILKEIQPKDSKKLNEKQRIAIYKKIAQFKPTFKIEKFSSQEVDRYGIGYCFKYAIESLRDDFQPDLILVDGKKINLGFKNVKFIIKGDSQLISLASISILAKVLRDNYMKFLHYYYPQYDFYSNKGYLTRKHFLAIKKYGLTKHHRLTFINFFF